MRVLPLPARLAILSALVAEDAYLDGAKVHLFKNDMTPTTTTVIGDFEEANFTGYAASAAVTWSSPFYISGAAARVTAGLKTFIASGSTVANTVYGYYVTDTAGTGLKYAERFGAPVPITQTGDAVVVQVDFDYNGVI